MEGPFSAEDELFLFETFSKITNDESQSDCLFFEDDNNIPLSEYFLFEKDIEQSQSPTDIIPSQKSPQQFFLASFCNQPQTSPSPCDSPTSLFRPLHLDNIFPSCTPPPSLSPTSPTLPPTSPSLQPPDYPISIHTPPPLETDLVTVHFIDLKELYEKTQVRRRGISEQRLVDCRVHMFAQFTKTLHKIEVCVCRYPETEDFENKMQFPVIQEKTLPNTQYFSINLDSVYQTSLGKPFYHLSTTHRFRKNRFVINVMLTFTDKSQEYFKSDPFLVRSRKQSPNPRKTRLNSH